jgi:hypothetical protein
MEADTGSDAPAVGVRVEGVATMVLGLLATVMETAADVEAA